MAYCKVPKVGTNSWGSFFARAGTGWQIVKSDDKVRGCFNILIFSLVAGTLEDFEKRLHIKVGNRSLEELRSEERYRGWRAMKAFMPIIGHYKG